MNANHGLSAAQIIDLLGLEPLPQEGGYFRETHRSNWSAPPSALPDAYGSERPLGSAIYYLITAYDCSRMHRLPGPELFHFYLGDPVEMLQLHADGSGERVLVGNRLTDGTRPQVMVPGGSWQGARLVPGGEFALMGTTMSPGFDFADFESGDRETLTAGWPKHVELIEALT